MKKLLKNKLLTFLVVFLASSGITIGSKLSSSTEAPNEMFEKLALADIPTKAVRENGKVLGEHTEENPLFFTVNVPSRFNEDISAPNVIYSLTGGTGISISTLNGEQDPSIINTGVLSFQETTGDVVLEAGTGITIDGLKITGVSENIFKTIEVDGESDVVAGSSTDILTFEGSGVVITTDAGGDKVIFTATEPNYDLSGWTDGGTEITLTTITDAVTVGALTFGNAIITNGNSFLPDTDLGSDIGSSSMRFNNLWVANINSNSSQAFSGQTTFSYAPTDNTISQASIIINPTTTAANGQLMALGIAGYQRALIDEDGDMILGYSGATSAPANTYPLAIYGHSASRVSYIDSAGNANFSGIVTAQGDVIIQGGELYITGQSSSSSTTAGTVFYDFDDNILKVYNGSSWASTTADTKSTTLIIAASDSNNTNSADYIANGTDDDVTIETAIAALPAGGGKIILLEGTFSIGDTAGDGVDITKSNVTIEGQGKATILQRAGDMNADWDGLIEVGDGGTTAVTDITIKNIAFDGQKDTYVGAANQGIYLNKDLRRTTIDSNYFYDHDGPAISTKGSSGDEVHYTLITNNQVFNGGRQGIQVNVYADYSIISGNISSGNTGNGIDVSSADRVVVINNLSESSGGYGIFVANSDESVISGNVIESSTKDGIYLSGPFHSSISNNTIKSSALTGIYVYYANNNSIIGNVINTVAASKDGIKIDGSDNNIITSNQISDTSGSANAINVSNSTSDNNLISNNYIFGGGWSAEINDAGTGTTFQQKEQFQIKANGEIALAVTQSGSADIMNILDGATEVFTILDGGNVGIGQDTPSYSLDVTGMIRATEGIATYTKAGTISDTDFTETAIDGQMAVDSTNGRIYFRHSGGWHYVAQTAGFQIPEYETFSFSFEENKFDTSKPLADGDFLIPFVDKHLEDGAIHGLYTKFSDVKGLLFEEETIRIGELESTVVALATATVSADLSDYATLTNTNNLLDLINELKAQLADTITSITGYFEEVFTDKSHQKELCIGEFDNETCLNKDQVDKLIELLPTPTPEASAIPSPEPSASPDPSPTPEATISAVLD